MPEFEMETSAIEVRRAVQEALEDLGAMSEGEVGPDGSHTTDARAKQKDYWGTRGATRKRLAEVEFLLGDDGWRKTLQEARDDYYAGLQLGGYRDHWLLGQFVVLRSVLKAVAERTAPVAKAAPKSSASRARPSRREPKRPWVDDSWWEETCGAVSLGLRSADPQERMWAWSSLADLRMVAMRERWPLPDTHGSTSVRRDLEEMVQAVGGPDHCGAVWPTFRQFWRWTEWWADPAWAEAAEEGYGYLWALVRPALDIEPPTVAARPQE